MTYALTAEIGYRYLGIDEVGAYSSLRAGNCGLTGLIYGADTIEKRPTFRRLHGLLGPAYKLVRNTG